MEIKKGKLNFDQSGRAYPDNPRDRENWDCIWAYEGKYYKLVGDNEHKEWDEVNIYNQIIDEVYRKYGDSHEHLVNGLIHVIPMEHSKETFVNECKTNTKFSKKWGLTIEERELSTQERYVIARSQSAKYKCPKWDAIDIDTNGNPIPKHSHTQDEHYDNHGIPTKLITLTYNNETIESYE